MPVNARRDERLIALLASGSTFTAAARAVGLHERTVRKKWADAAFRQRVEEAQRDLFDRSMAKMAGLASKSIDTLSALLVSRSDAVRLGAVRLVNETLARRRESYDFEAQLRELQALADHQGERQ